MTPYEFISDMNKKNEVKLLIVDEAGLTCVIKIGDRPIESINDLVECIRDFYPCNRFRFADLTDSLLSFGLEKIQGVEPFEYKGDSL